MGRPRKSNPKKPKNSNKQEGSDSVTEYSTDEQQTAEKINTTGDSLNGSGSMPPDEEDSNSEDGVEEVSIADVSGSSARSLSPHRLGPGTDDLAGNADNLPPNSEQKQNKSLNESTKSANRGAEPESTSREEVYQPKPVKSELFTLIPVAILLFGVGFVLLQTKEAGIELHEKSVVDKFLDKISYMQSQTTQDKKLWRIVKSSMREHIVENNPTQPSVLMLVSTKESSEMREKLAREIAEAYSIRCQDSDIVMVHGANYAIMDHDSAKKEVDDILISGFEAKSCAAVVSNFEKLPAATTKVFYQFCENDYAPFKDVAVIFTLEVEPGPWDPDKTLLVPGMTPEPNMWDPIVDAYLYHSLESRDDSGTMKRDMIGGLLTRITPGVVWVK